MKAEERYSSLKSIAAHQLHQEEWLTDKFLQSSEARQVAQDVATAVQNHCYTQIGHIVTKCLSAVFDDPYTFELVFTQKAGRTQVGFQFMRNGERLDPMTSTGGGVVDIASFALRIAGLLMSKPAKRQLLILDEPFRFVSVEYRDRVRLLIEKLAGELGIQFILVTHMEELQCGKVIQTNQSGSR